MKRSKDYSWPTSPLNSCAKRSPKRQRKLENLVQKLSEVESSNSSLSAEARELKKNIKDLTNLD